MGKESVKKEKLEEKEFEKVVDWGLETQLTWSVIFLTCFIGLIELLPIVPGFDPSSSLSEMAYLVFIGSIYAFLVVGLGYSIYRTAGIVRWNFEWSRRTTNSKLGWWLSDTRGWLIKTLLGSHGEFLTSTAIGVLMLIWTSILILKVFFIPSHL